MEKNVRILLVDDHQIVREALQQLLKQEEDMEIVGQSASGEEALSHVEMFYPNIVLTDIKMPGVNGIELTRQLKKKQPSCRVIMLTLYDEYLTQAIEAGAVGYLHKDIKREGLIQAIRLVHGGKMVISESITSKPRIKYEEIGSGKSKEGLPQEHSGSDTIIEDVELVLPPPGNANQLLRFVHQLDEMLKEIGASIGQMVGSYDRGTIIMIHPGYSSPANLIDALRNIPGVEKVEEKQIATDTFSIRKFMFLPRPRNIPRKRVLITLK